MINTRKLYEKFNVNERFSNMTGVNFLIDQLSNSMEYYNNADEFANHIYNETGNQNLRALKRIYKDYWDELSANDRLSYTTEDWEEWLYVEHTDAINENYMLPGGGGNDTLDSALSHFKKGDEVWDKDEIKIIKDLDNDTLYFTDGTEDFYGYCELTSESNRWMDPAGGIHYDVEGEDFDDPAAMYESDLKAYKNDYYNYYSLYKKLVDEYDWKIGDEVTIEHKTWNAPRTMIVTSIKPELTLELAPVVLKFPPAQMRDFLFVLPTELIPEVDEIIKAYKKDQRGPKKITEKTKTISEKKYWEILTDFSEPGDTGIEDYDPDTSGFAFDMAENIYYSFPEIITYVRKEYGLNSKADIMERIQWDIESLM
jgi:hypothetical protein